MFMMNMSSFSMAFWQFLKVVFELIFMMSFSQQSLAYLVSIERLV